MTGLPRSLFVRSAVLIAGLMIISQLITALLFMYWVQLPRLQVIAGLATSHLHGVRTALALIPDAQRPVYIRAMTDNFGLHLQDTAPDIRPVAMPYPFVIDKFIKLYQQQLASQEEVIYQAEPEPAVWVQIVVNQKPYWIKYDAKPFSSDFDRHWLGPMAFLAVLALLGGLIIHRTLNKPLQRLADVVKRIGKGQRVEFIKEQGPDEIIAFIHALNRMNTDLKQMDADRNLMLAGISHDLRTPITRIQLALAMLGGDFDIDMKNRILANLNEIDGGLRQCLDFARDSADEITQLADLNELARLCAASYQANGFNIELDLCETAEAYIRPFALERLLKNLLENAIKYAGVGISITTRIADGALYLSVSDRGAGIADTDIDKLRRPFARADTSRGSVGYGLGLAIVDKIIDAHHAEISFLQREGGGLEVRIKLVSANTEATNLAY